MGWPWLPLHNAYSEKKDDKTIISYWQLTLSHNSIGTTTPSLPLKILVQWEALQYPYGPINYFSVCINVSIGTATPSLPLKILVQWEALRYPYGPINYFSVCINVSIGTATLRCSKLLSI